MEPGAGRTYVGPDLGSSLFAAIALKYWNVISIPNRMGYSIRCPMGFCTLCAKYIKIG